MIIRGYMTSKKQQRTDDDNDDDEEMQGYKTRKMMNLQVREMKTVWKKIAKVAVAMAKESFACCFACVSSSPSSSCCCRISHDPHRLLVIMPNQQQRNRFHRLNPSVDHDEEAITHSRPRQSCDSATLDSAGSAAMVIGSDLVSSPPPPPILILKPPTSPSASSSSPDDEYCDVVFPLFYNAFAEIDPNLSLQPALHSSRRIHHLMQQHKTSVSSLQSQINVNNVDLHSFRSESLTSALHSSSTNHDDTVLLKIGLLGDSETGKTSFMAKYVAAKQGQEYVETVGVASVEKLFRLRNNVNIALSIWDLGGHWQCSTMLPMVCADAAAIFIMFDLTRRSTLQSVKDWFLQARTWNKAAIPVIVGTKYDQFVELPHDIQFAIIQQARFYAKAMEAALFFSSVTHNINVHKIFKVIVAKVFDLPCTISRNLNFGEPIIDY